MLTSKLMCNLIYCKCSVVVLQDWYIQVLWVQTHLKIAVCLPDIGNWWNPVAWFFNLCHYAHGDHCQVPSSQMISWQWNIYAVNGWKNRHHQADGSCIYKCCVIFFRIIGNNIGYDTNCNQYEISLYIFITSSYPSVISKKLIKVVTMCQITWCDLYLMWTSSDMRGSPGEWYQHS